MSTLGFLHTAEVHVDTFDALVRAASPESRTVHLVVPDLLDRARVSGPTPELSADIRSSLSDLTVAGAEVVVCTCSTVGGLAEDVASDVSVPVLRVDRPMARVAVGTGPRIAVVAALESTLAPTRDLLTDEAGRAGASVALVEVCVPEAWAAFEAGDTTAYLGQVAAAARSVAAAADVVVLAQASMAGAVDQLVDLPVPVLVSPRLAVESALQAARD